MAPTETDVAASRPGDLTVSGGVNAADNARLHIGNINNLTNYRYTLAKRKSDETLRSDRRNEELLRAAAEGQTPRVRHLLDLEADFDYRDALDLTALHHAVFSGFEDVVELLIQRGADVNSPSLNVGTPLMLAVLKQRSNVVKLLLCARGINVDATAESLGSVIHCAAWATNLEIVNMVVAHGSDEDREKRLRCEADIVLPALRAVCSWTGSRTPFSADGPYAHWSHATPLLLAVFHAKLAVVKLLHTQEMAMDREWEVKTSGGMETDPTDISGWSIGLKLRKLDLAWIAVARNQETILEYLLSHGAMADNVYDDGTTLLVRAAREGHADCLKALLTRQPEIDRRDAAGRTALSFAAERGQQRCVNILLVYRALNSVVDDDGDTPLHYAATKGHSEIVHLLIVSGVDVDSANKKGQTALWIAMREQQLEVASSLVMVGASLNSTSHDGTSVLRLLLKHYQRRGWNDWLTNVFDEAFQSRWWAGTASVVDEKEKFHAIHQAFASTQYRPNEDPVGASIAEVEAQLYNHCASSAENAHWLLAMLHALGGNACEDNLGLAIAIQRGDVVCLARLLDHQAKVGLHAGPKRTSATLGRALRIAVQWKHTAIVQLLVERGADLAISHSGWSPLMHFAAECSSIEIIQILCKAGGNLQDRNSRGQTPLQAAVGRDGQFRSALGSLAVSGEHNTPVAEWASDERTDSTYPSNGGPENATVRIAAKARQDEGATHRAMRERLDPRLPTPPSVLWRARHQQRETNAKLDFNDDADAHCVRDEHSSLVPSTCTTNQEAGHNTLLATAPRNVHEFTLHMDLKAAHVTDKAPQASTTGQIGEPRQDVQLDSSVGPKKQADTSRDTAALFGKAVAVSASTPDTLRAVRAVDLNISERHLDGFEEWYEQRYGKGEKYKQQFELLYGDAVKARRNRTNRGALEFMSAALTSKKPLDELANDVKHALKSGCPSMHVLYGLVDMFDIKDRDRVKRIFVCTPGDSKTLKTPLKFEISIVKVPLKARTYAVVFKQQDGDESLYTGTVIMLTSRLQRYIST